MIGIDELTAHITVLLRTHESTISKRLMGLGAGGTTNDMKMHADSAGHPCR